MQNSSSNRPVEDEAIYDVCTHVLSLDRSILFCALAHKSGYLMALATTNDNDRNKVAKNNSAREHAEKNLQHSPGIDRIKAQDFLSEVELEKYIFQSGIIWGIHKLWEKKLGRIQHVVSYYDEMPLAIIFLDGSHFLLMAIDLRTKNRNIDKIILEKVVPSLGKLSFDGASAAQIDR